MTMSNSLFGFILNPTGSLPKNRSPLKAILNLAYAGNPVGSVVLSDGPAYGAEILTEVIRGWWLASLIAVILAAAAGWWVSRRMMAPLITLAGATASMAGGNLSARAVVQSTDEFGELGRSFNTMAERVEEIVGTLRGFVADAAHQLMTPLTALRTNLELASDETNPARRRDYLDNANAQMARMETLVNSLLELSRLEASGVTPARERFDLSQVVRSAAETAASRAEQTGRQFSLALPAGPVALDGDETRIRHALDNLLDNAIKFTPAGGSVRLQLSTAAGWVTLAVEDDGPGIPSEDLPHVFERFHRGMNSAGIPGSGLGLAIVKAIVEIHQGKVIVESTEHGTRVEMRFLATPLHLPGSTRIDA
jgi:signal transduction histidine kinase